MGQRQDWISEAILRAVYDDLREQTKALFRKVLELFTFFRLKLIRFEPAIFMKLRSTVWKLNEEEYRESFRIEKSKKTNGLQPIGDLGYSGSSFFVTSNSKYLIKSLPRRFEYKFFQQDLIRPYFDHMTNNPQSLLVRITDFLTTPSPTLGSAFGLTPSRHIVMENTMFGKEHSDKPDDWETYDLKPTSYFFPERDIAEGTLTSEAIKSRLADDFPDKIRVSIEQSEELLKSLRQDTELLKKANAVDYSLFLVRYPASNNPPYIEGEASKWRTGAESTDKKWKYRAVLLDFFWAKHSTQAKAMDTAVQTYNVIGRHGPMSITTTPEEYRERFLKMVSDLIEFPTDN